MTKHNKKHMSGGIKRTMSCTDCDYVVKGSKKEAYSKMTLHMRIKHNININDVKTVNTGTLMVDNINNNMINNEAQMMADILRLLNK